MIDHEGLVRDAREAIADTSNDWKPSGFYAVVDGAGTVIAHFDNQADRAFTIRSQSLVADLADAVDTLGRELTTIQSNHKFALESWETVYILLGVATTFRSGVVGFTAAELRGNKAEDIFARSHIRQVVALVSDLARRNQQLQDELDAANARLIEYTKEKTA